MPKSESVWFEEVDRGLKTILTETVQVPIEGVLSPVTVDINKSDEDFKVDVYPSISIYCASYSLDKSRKDTLQEVITKIDENTCKGKLEQVAQSYKLTYKITLWSKLQSQMNYMTRILLSTLGQFYNLEVFDASGNPRTCFMSLTNPITKGDILTDNSRIFQTVFTYSICVELDERIQKEVPIIKMVEPKIAGETVAKVNKI